jgi:hypothetical protein
MTAIETATASDAAEAIRRDRHQPAATLDLEPPATRSGELSAACSSAHMRSGAD